MSANPIIPKNSTPYFPQLNQDQDPVTIHITPQQNTIVELAQCRICRRLTSSDGLASFHDNCRKEICHLCLPTLELCPSCNERINRPGQNIQMNVVVIAPGQQPAPVPIHHRRQLAQDPLIPESERVKLFIMVALIICGAVLMKILG